MEKESRIRDTGWICPKCGRVYSPYTPMCRYCGGGTGSRIAGRTATAPGPEESGKTDGKGPVYDSTSGKPGCGFGMNGDGWQ